MASPTMAPQHRNGSKDIPEWLKSLVLVLVVAVASWGLTTYSNQGVVEQRLTTIEKMLPEKADGKLMESKLDAIIAGQNETKDRLARIERKQDEDRRSRR